MSVLILTLLQLSILAYAIVGGVFLAFSDFIMRSLARTGGQGGVEAMQRINREVFRWVFMALFLGMAAVSVLILLNSAFGFGAVPSALVPAAASIYLIGCFAVTVVFNVPMNEALADMDPESPAARAYWIGTYVPRWTRWNSVRSLACLLSAGIMLLGITA